MTQANTLTPEQQKAAEKRRQEIKEKLDQRKPLKLSHILYALSRPTPINLCESRKQGGTRLFYVPWYRAQKHLTRCTLGFWRYEIIERTVDDDNEALMITVRITIVAEEGEYYREGTGYEPLNGSGYGDPQSNAESMAFRRCLAHWGFGLDLYDKSSETFQALQSIGRLER